MESNATRPTRREWLRTGLALPALLLLPTRMGAGAVELDVTPDCADGPTPSIGPGPFFKPDSPLRRSLFEPGTRGQRLVLSGRVLDRSCRPVAGALLDFWQADPGGAYDQAGFRLRGHQFADAAGSYRLETVRPGGYTGRTPHIHVRVQAPAGPVLTTQLFFPEEPRNLRDGLFRPQLVVELALGSDAAGFDFVVRVG